MGRQSNCQDTFLGEKSKVQKSIHLYTTFCAQNKQKYKNIQVYLSLNT